MMNAWAVKAARLIYRLLLSACPRDMRDRGGAEALFDGMLIQATERAGWKGFTWFCLGAFGDTVLAAALGWLRIIGIGLGPGRTTGRLASMLTDVRLGVRSMRHTPLATSIAVGTVAVAIALTTLTLSTVYGVLLRPLPFEGSDRMMAISLAGVDLEAGDLRYFRERQSAFENVEGYLRSRPTVLGLGDYPESVPTAFVTASALTYLGVAPILGGLFPAGEGVTEPVQHVVVSYDLWRNRYGGRVDVLGRRLRVGAYDLEIIGVMPEGFHFPVAESMWVPLSAAYGGSFSWFGRLRLDRTRAYAEAEAESIMRRLRSDDRGPQQTREGPRVFRFALRHLPAGIDDLLYVMLAAVAGVLLIACSNLANLMRARSATRGREVAIRGALGASRGRIVQQFLIEALVLSAAGSAIGLGLAFLGMDGLTGAVTNVPLPYWVEFRADGTVLATSVFLMVSVALVAGTLPAMRAARGSARPRIDSGGRGSSAGTIGRLGSGLVTVQIALSLALLIGAGLLIKSVTRVRSMDPGFDAERILTARIILPRATHPDPNRSFLALIDELEALPSVEHVAVARSAPGTGSTFDWEVSIEGEEYGVDSSLPFADGKNIGHGYFEAMGLDLVEGRDFTPDETLFRRGTAGPGVVIVNRTFAQRYLGSAPIGRRVQLGGPDSDDPWLRVVGVVEDGYVGSRSGGIGLGSVAAEQMYIPWGFVPYNSGALLFRTRGEPELSISEIRASLAELAPGVPLVEPVQLSRRIEETTWAFGLFGRVFTAFGAAALLMSVAGLYGVIAFNVRQRRREMGTRLALGADPAGIVRLSMRDGAIQVGVGLLVGSSLGLLVAEALRAVIFDVSKLDVQVYAVAIGTVILAGLTASFIPALATLRLDPQTALRPD